MSTEANANPWQPLVRGLARFVAGRVPRDDAEDIAQEVLLRLHQRSGDLRHEDRAEAWIYGIARRTIADYYRARKRQPAAHEATDDLAAPAAETLPGFARFEGDHSTHEEVLSWLRPLVDGLPDKYREALLLADFEGLSRREIGERLGLSLSGAKSRVQRARTMLGESLRQCCEVELGPDGKAVDFKRLGCDC